MVETTEHPETNERARLLVVDDEANLRAGLRDLLSLMGYEVEEAASGHEALRLLDGASYDLMLLDMRMPGMDGIEVMRRAREMYPDLAIIVLTAHASLESAIASVKSDAADYMLKPINIDDLAATIERALQDREEQQRRQRLVDMIGQAVDILNEPERATPTPPPPPAGEPAPPPSDAETPSPQRFLRAGPLMLDCQKRMAVVDRDTPSTVELTEGEATVLAALMERPNQVLASTQLAHAITGHDLEKWEAQSLIRPCIHRLRRKIEVAPKSPRLIRTVRGRGYFLSPDE